MGEDMPRRGVRRRAFEPAVFGTALLAFLLWSVGASSGWAGRTVDTWLPVAHVAPRSYLGQVAESFALLTNPWFVMIVAAALAAQAYRRRHRHLATALTVAALGIPLWAAVRHLIDRPRPSTGFADSISAAGSAYPSGHIVAVSVLVWVLVTVANSQRRSPSDKVTLRLVGVALVVVAGAVQWLMSTSHLSDLIGGWLFGVVIGTGALWLSGVESISRTWAARAAHQGRRGRAAIVYNPTKIDDLAGFKRRVGYAMASTGWSEPVWLETRSDDPGVEMARDAVAKGVNRVLVAGGDGTVRAVCAELAGRDIPVAIIPAGTGNLLGRNLGIPLDEDEALELAVSGTPRAVDVVRWSAGDSTDAFVVMAGVGLDAQIMRDTNDTLKRVVKGGAYVIAGLQQVGLDPFRAKVTVDGVVIHDGDAIMALVGNVGKLQGGIALLPAASASDGRLHVLIATSEGIRGIKKLANALRRRGPMPFIKRGRGKRVEVELDREVAFQLDGDTDGSTRSFTAEIMPAALRVVAPRPRDNPGEKQG